MLIPDSVSLVTGMFASSRWPRRSSGLPADPLGHRGDLGVEIQGDPLDPSRAERREDGRWLVIRDVSPEIVGKDRNPKWRVEGTGGIVSQHPAGDQRVANQVEGRL